MQSAKPIVDAQKIIAIKRNEKRNKQILWAQRKEMLHVFKGEIGKAL